MYEKERSLFEAFVAKKLDRRELIQGAGKLGLSFGAASILLNQAQTAAMAADFDWMKFKGSKLKLLLNKHPYADAMIANLESFKTMTAWMSPMTSPGRRLLRQGDGCPVLGLFRV